MMPELISVVIATRNRAPVLRDTLAAFRQQRHPGGRFELLVADNGSTDGTREAVESWRAADGAAARYLYVHAPGKSLAVNAALGAVRGDVVAFTDDDVRPHPDWLAALARAFTDPSVDFVAGRILPIWTVPPPAWMSPALFGVLAVPDNGSERQPLRADGGIMPIGANMAVRQRVLTRVGGLCESLGKLEGSLRTGEDHEFFLRLLSAGCHGVYEPEALVHHLVPAERLREAYFRRWLYQNGRDVAQLERLYPPDGRTLAGVPGFRWREAAHDAWAATRALLTGDVRTRVAATVRLAWFTGYVRELASRAAAPTQPPRPHGASSAGPAGWA